MWYNNYIGIHKICYGGTKMLTIKPNDKRLSYEGRIALSEEGAVMYYPGSSVTMRVNAENIGFILNERRSWGTLSVGLIVDGEPQKPIRLEKENIGKDTEYSFDLSGGEHIVTVYKVHAGGNHILTFKGFELDGELLDAPEKPKLKLEVFGDSVCAGEVTMAVDNVGKSDPENHDSIYDNSYYSFVMMTARMLNAQIHNNSQGGIALLDGTGYFNMPETIGLETTFDKECYIKDAGYTDWDFTRYTPDVVIIAIGQNDNHEEGKPDRDINDPAIRTAWKTRYKEMVETLHSHYYTAKYVLTTTLLMHDKAWDDCIEELKNELRAEGIPAYHNVFTRNGAATPGHPRIPEDEEMARELAGFIRGIMQ